MTIDELRAEWREEVYSALRQGNAKRALYLLACNVGDRGSIKSLVDWLTAETWRMGWPEETDFGAKH